MTIGSPTKIKLKKIIYKLVFPLAVLYFFIFRPKTRGVKCVIEHYGKVLLIKNSYGKHRWTFPGGGIKKYETPLEAAIRETKEEVNLDLEDPKLIGSFKNNYEYKEDNVFVFRELVSDANYQIDNEEIDMAQWFQITSLPELGPVAQKVWEIYKQSA